MNKYFKLFAGLAVAMTFASCSDEPNVGPENEENKPIGDIAYMAVRIQSASDSRSRGTDGGFQDSDDQSHASNFANEHDVKSAKFFFFDANGVYVTTATLNTAPTFAPVNNDNPNNIEFNAPGVLVLDKLSQAGYPKYMLTVLNPAEGFDHANTLKETAEKLHDYYMSKSTGEGDAATTSNYFTMSTTSYYGGATPADVHHQDVDGTLDTYHVTTLKPTDFKVTPEAARDTVPVDVYVERLAAKVEVTFDQTKATKEFTFTNEDNTTTTVKAYKLTSTLAGSDNDDENANPAATTDLYVYVTGWTLNATSNKSYISKQLKSDWATDATKPFTSWQNASLFRSYWAKGTSYGNTPTIGTGDTHINYQTTNALKNQNYLYCNENTNDAVTGHIFTLPNGETDATKATVDSRYVTHVAIRTVVCDENGKSVSLIKYMGLHYTEDAFKKYILSTLQSSTDGLNYWIKTSETATEEATEKDFLQIGTDFLDFQKEGDIETGKCKMIVNATTKAATTVYKKVQEDGEDKWVEVEDADWTALADRLPNNLTRATNGNTVYYLPIEHLAGGTNKLVEGYYGVVRNHWYKITISDFKKLGHGIYDPNSDTEKLIPEGPEDPLYYVGAKINILNWHIVNQNSEL